MEQETIFEEDFRHTERARRINLLPNYLKAYTFILLAAGILLSANFIVQLYQIFSRIASLRGLEKTMAVGFMTGRFLHILICLLLCIPVLRGVRWAIKSVNVAVIALFILVAYSISGSQPLQAMYAMIIPPLVAPYWIMMRSIRKEWENAGTDKT